MIRRWNYLRTPIPSGVVDPEGARAAVIKSRQVLLDEQSRTGKVNEVSMRLRHLQERNHFADLLESAYVRSRESSG